MNNASSSRVAGVILAGGQSRRMGGGDKCLRLLGERTILDHIVDRARPQVSDLVLNANGDLRRFDACGLPVTADEIPGHAGPLAGVLSGLDWVAGIAPDTVWMASFASDAPFFPRNLVERLLAAVRRDGADMACAASGGRRHPVFALWPMALREPLRIAVGSEQVRKVDAWTDRYRLAVAEFSIADHDPFFNVNRPEDLETASTIEPR